MKSPFPGMDPYLEQHWLDVHARLVLYACDQIEEQLPGGLIARVEERVVFETEEPAEHWAYLDVRVAELPAHVGNGARKGTASAVAEPIFVQVEPEPATETFVNIVDVESGGRRVTVVEVLSLANKLAGKGQRDYRRKQEELRRGQVNLVEIDLLRRGHRVLMVPVARIPKKARTAYQACVWRATNPTRCEVYPLPLRHPLPAIPVPLRETDGDARLDLQSIVEVAYRKGRYHSSIDYSEPPDPPLAKKDARWARMLIKKAGKSG